MSNITPDYLIERKRNKNQLGKWKLAVLLLIIILFFSSWKNILPNNSGITKNSFTKSNYIASIKINNVIMDDNVRIRKLSSIEEDKSVKAVIVHVNSPGGSVVGSEMIYNALRKISKKKPVVVVMESLAASGGYLVALGGDYIIAHNGTITGSIGVIMQSAELTELAKMVGVTFNNFKSDSLKASPNITEKLTPEVHQATMDSIYEVYDYFVGVVATRRNLDLDYTKKLADGRIYSGKQAFDLKLIDAIGDQDTALSWLQEKRGISKDLKIVDIKLSVKEKLIDMLIKDLKNSISGFFAAHFQGMKSTI